MAKKYYENYDIVEYVYPADWWQDHAEAECREIKVEECKRDIGGEMWCRDEGEFVIDQGTCGRVCASYSPCNGKSGRCRFLQNGFIGTGKYKIFKPIMDSKITFTPADRR